MKSIQVLIKITELDFKADPALVKYLLWDTLLNGRSKLEEVFRIEEVLVHNIEEVPTKEIPF